MRRSRYTAKIAWRVILILLLTGLALFPLSAQPPLNAIGEPLEEILRFPLIAVAFIDRQLQTVWSVLWDMVRAQSQNQKLTRELAVLRADNDRLREATEALERYHMLFEFREQCPYETMVAQVIGRDPTNWHRSLIIARGERDGVRAEMGVINPQGVVGRLVKVRRAFSVVQLATDRDNAITAMVQRTRDEGIVQGAEGGMVKLKYLPPLSTVRKGDIVIASGLDEKFPKGVRIGTITRVEQAMGAPFASASLTPDVDFSKLEEVLILTSSTRMAGRKGEC